MTGSNQFIINTAQLSSKTANAALRGRQRKQLRSNWPAVTSHAQLNQKCQALTVPLKCFVRLCHFF
ncbi:hypothetical protein CYG20_17260 [Vibrio cholerae]|nr:hypothetical protein [Vibrio cholerae]